MKKSVAVTILAVPLVLATFSSGAVTAETDLNLWPLLVVESDEQGSNVEFLTPFGQFMNRGGEQIAAIRPIYMWNANASGSESLDILWPIFRVQQFQGQPASWRLLPVMYNNLHGKKSLNVLPLLFTTWYPNKPEGEYHSVVLLPAFYASAYGEGPDWMHGIFPLYCIVRDEYETMVALPATFWSQDNDGHFLMVFPLLSSWRHRENRTFWLAPFYWNARYGQNAKRTFGLFPLFHDRKKQGERGTWIAPFYWGREDGKTSAFVAFPVYWRGENSQVLFPLYWNFDHGRVFMVLPFYGHIKGYESEGVRDTNRDFLTIMWPLYMTQRKADYRKHHILWPFVRWGSGKDNNWEFQLFPLIGADSSQSADKDGWQSSRAWRALFPLVWSGHDEWAFKKSARRSQSAYFNIFPILWLGNGAEWYLQEEKEAILDGESSHANVFPIFWHNEHWRTRRLEGTPDERETRNETNVFPLYWSGKTATAKLDAEGKETGVESHNAWNMLIPLYTYTSDDKGAAFTCLWPLWRNAESAEMDQYSVLWRLFDARYYPNGDHSVRVLWHGFRHIAEDDSVKLDTFPFISYRRPDKGQSRFRFLGGFFACGKEDDKRFVRLLYLPRISWGGK